MEQKVLTAADIKVGQWYRAKTPRITRTNKRNDRCVIWMNTLRTQVQYDGPAVPRGSHYPTVSMEAFLKWAGCECEGPRT